MAISYPITLPTAPAPVRVKLTARSTAAMSQSPFTGEQQVYAHQGQWWEAVVEYPVMPRAHAEPILSALVQLLGRKGTLLLGDADAAVANGSLDGAPVVDGAGQSGQTLATRGWTNNASGVLAAGDYIQVGSGTAQRLYKVLNDANADSAGEATLDIFPRLRESPADGATIVTAACKGTFRLQSDETPWETDNRRLYKIAFAAIEAF